MIHHRKTLAPVFFLLLTISACSKKADDAAEAGLLRYVPSDAPYVIVTQERLPDDLYDKLEPQIDAVLAAYQKLMHAMVDAAIAEAEQDESDMDEEELEKLSAIVAELDSLLSLDGLDSAGINRDSRFALYGNGLLPVFRMTLSDGALLEQAIARIEASAAQNMDTIDLNGQKLRVVSDDDWRVILGVIGNQMVLSAAPETLDDAQLQELLGMTLPASHIGDTTRLTDIRGKYDFHNFMIGLIDIDQVAATLLEPPTGLNAALFASTDFDVSDLDDVCRDEIRSLAGVMPRIVTGYTNLSVDEMASKLVLELREDIASGLQTIAAPVPGLGQRHDGLLSFGMSFDLLALREFYSARLDAIEADPYQCEFFADYQDGVAAGREMLNQPIPPVAYSFRGFLAVIHDVVGMDLQNDIPPSSVDMQMLVATDNAEGLLAMGAMFSPEIAALQLEPGGDPVLLESPQLDQLGQTAYVAMSDDALAVSVGEGMQDGLTGLLQNTGRRTECIFQHRDGRHALLPVRSCRGRRGPGRRTRRPA